MQRLGRETRAASQSSDRERRFRGEANPSGIEINELEKGNVNSDGEKSLEPRWR